MIRSSSAGALVLAVLAVASVAAPAPAATLEATLARVAERNPMLRARDAEVEAARARATRAGAWPAPMAMAGVVNVPTRGGFDMDAMTMKMLGVSQRLPLFGANRLARSAALQAANADTASRSALRRELLGRAWDAYAEAYAAGERQRIAEAHRGEMERMVAAARARYESGRGRLEDLMRTESEAARVLADAAAYRGEEAAARAELAALTDAAPDTTRLEQPPAPIVIAGLDTWRRALEDHPRLVAWTATERSRELSARAARRMRWPDLELAFSWGFREPLDFGHGTHLVDQDDMWTATAEFMLPLFAGSREGAESREMTAMARAAAAERDAAGLELERSLAAAHARALAVAQATRLSVETVVPAQRRTLQASWSGYESGVGDLLGVLDVAHGLYQEELAAATRRRELCRAHAELLALTGRADLLGVTISAPEGKE
jgi:outer membrane protein, heavy metal efflux system